VAVFGGVKRYVTAMILGALAPLVVAVILVQRLGRKKATIQLRRLKKNLGPQIDKAVEERERWRSELAIGEVIEWALQSSAFNPRPKK
jgi:hypothetical protein